MPHENVTQAEIWKIVLAYTVFCIVVYTPLYLLFYILYLSNHKTVGLNVNDDFTPNLFLYDQRNSYTLTFLIWL